MDPPKKRASADKKNGYVPKVLVVMLKMEINYFTLSFYLKLINFCNFYKHALQNYCIRWYDVEREFKETYVVPC